MPGINSCLQEAAGPALKVPVLKEQVWKASALRAGAVSWSEGHYFVSAATVSAGPRRRAVSERVFLFGSRLQSELVGLLRNHITIIP